MLLAIAKANLNVQDGKTMSTPLHLAIEEDNENAVEALTQFRGCDANLKVTTCCVGGVFSHEITSISTGTQLFFLDMLLK